MQYVARKLLLLCCLLALCLAGCSADKSADKSTVCGVQLSDREKKIAMGHKADDHEEQVPSQTMSMG